MHPKVQQFMRGVRRVPKRVWQVAGALVVLGLVFLIGRSTVDTNPLTSQVSWTPAELHGEIYVVQPGDFLNKIADQHGVGREAMILANESYLVQKFEETCSRFSNRYTNNPRRRGLFCNERFNRPFANTLMPNWQLMVPYQEAPAFIQEVVAFSPGTKVALVIDDTGSMSDDIQVVSEWYLAAARQFGKQLTGVFLYADGEVRRYNATGAEFLTEGGEENTHHALREAATHGFREPDALILVTDEPGDDWDWGDVDNLPPVMAHCLDGSCQNTLSRLARETGGKYTEGLSGPGGV